jgi:serine/threonine-protein kinase
MRIKGPIITLVAGLVVAGVLLGLSLAATKVNKDPSTANAGNVGTAASSPAAEPSASAPAPSESAGTNVPAAAPLTFAGRVNGGAATIAIAVRDGKAIAYLCNGRNLEAWLQGDAKDGKLALTGAKQASLTGGYDNTYAEGSVTAAGRTYAFRVQMVQAPDGLYRLAAPVANKQTVGGWIQVRGEQTGMVSIDGVGQPAPTMDPATGKVVINGVETQAGKVDGANPIG